MNSPPPNAHAPVFIPGTVACTDILLAESPRKPLPMDDIELPDVTQFQTEANSRPAELLDLDNSDLLNGQHNVSFEGFTEQLNGNERLNLDNSGFGFSVDSETDKVKNNAHIDDLKGIQGITDSCKAQVFEVQTEANPFTSHDNEELLERLKNNERDPMSMSFYQEEDEDSCDRELDLNTVRTLPGSDDEDLSLNSSTEDTNKENINPGMLTSRTIPELSNDVTLNDRAENLSIPGTIVSTTFMDFSPQP